MLWEAMVAEMRAQRLDLHARATFAKDGEQIKDTRGVLDELRPRVLDIETQVARTSSRLTAAHDAGFVEVG